MAADKVQIAAGRVSAAKRWGTIDLAQAEAELREAQLEKQIVATLPSLDQPARDRLAALLAGSDLL